MSHQRLQIGEKTPDFNFQTPWTPQQKFYEAISDFPSPATLTANIEKETLDAD